MLTWFVKMCNRVIYSHTTACAAAQREVEDPLLRHAPQNEGVRGGDEGEGVRGGGEGGGEGEGEREEERERRPEDSPDGANEEVRHQNLVQLSERVVANFSSSLFHPFFYPQATEEAPPAPQEAQPGENRPGFLATIFVFVTSFVMSLFPQQRPDFQLD